MNIEGLGLLVTNLVVNYVHEAFYADQLLIHIGVGDVSKTRVALIYQVLHAGSQQEIARALTTVAFYDYQQKKVALMPEKLVQALGCA